MVDGNQNIKNFDEENSAKQIWFYGATLFVKQNKIKSNQKTTLSFSAKRHLPL